MINKVNAQTHQMQTFINGKLRQDHADHDRQARASPPARGVKVIIEKFRQKRMNSETVGISRNDPEAYDIDDVEYAMRVTYTGEFLHAAPWSVGSQGYANVSHGCTGMSTANAEWLYDRSKRGDVVEYTGTDRPMTLDNGYGDWNASYASWQAGSALSDPPAEVVRNCAPTVRVLASEVSMRPSRRAADAVLRGRTGAVRKHARSARRPAARRCE